MVWSLRLLLTPRRQGAPTSGGHADGARVQLTTMGPPGSRLEEGQTSPARLELEGEFSANLRKPDPAETCPLAVVEGRITRTADQVRFVADESGLVPMGPDLAVFDSDSPPRLAPDEEPPRVLQFRFDSAQFHGLGAPGHGIRVACDVKKYRYLEVVAQLEIDGSVEAGFHVNDRLDVLITKDNPPPLNLLTVRLHDADAVPLSAARARLQLPTGTKALVADGEGVVTVLLPEVCPARLPLQWGPADADELPYEIDLAPDCNRRSDGSELAARLNNLGYPAREDIDLAVRAFQRAYDVDATPEPAGLIDGRVPPLTRAKLDAIFTGSCDARSPAQKPSEGGV